MRGGLKEPRCRQGPPALRHRQHAGHFGRRLHHWLDGDIEAWRSSVLLAIHRSISAQGVSRIIGFNEASGLLAAALCGPTAARAQGLDKAWRIAFLSAGGAPRPGAFSTFEVIVAGLRERGWPALQTQAWYAEGRADALPSLAQQVLAWRADVIVARFTPAMLAVVKSVSTTLGLELFIERVGGQGEYVDAFIRWRRQRVEALIVQPSLAIEPAAALALQHGLPSCSIVRDFAEQGGLLAMPPTVPRLPVFRPTRSTVSCTVPRRRSCRSN